MTASSLKTLEYRNWLSEIKQRIRQAQVKAASQVNSALLTFYWEMGADILQRQQSSKWGSGFLKQLSADLMAEFPDMKGFSSRNLRYIRSWYLFYSQGIANLATGCCQIESQNVEQDPMEKNGLAVPQLKGQQVVAKLIRIPWGHHLAIISKCKDVTEALYYSIQDN